MLFEATGGTDMRDLAMLKKRFQALLPRYFPAQYIARATALMEQYVDYRVALGSLKPPQTWATRVYCAPRSMRASRRANNTSPGTSTRRSLRKKRGWGATPWPE